MSKESLRKNINNYDLYIFDLDGTLYFQKPFRIRMALYLIMYIFKHPSSIKDVLLIKEYRKVRENWEERDIDEIGKSIDESLSIDNRQYEYVARKKNSSAEKVRDAVEFFMMKAPLSLLPDYVDDNLKKFIKKMRENSKVVVIYSDYPVKDKLNALGIDVDGMYTSTDENIGVMKPDGKGIEVILSDYDISGENAIMIGDRYEKDGLCAIANNVDYIILSSKKEERKVI